MSIILEVVKGTVDRTSISKVTTYHRTIDHDDVWVGMSSLMEKTTERGRWFYGFESCSIPNLFKLKITIMLNLNELDSKLNNALENETSESLTNWLIKKRLSGIEQHFFKQSDLDKLPDFLKIKELEQKFDEILDSFDSEKLRDWLTFAEQQECEQDVNEVVEPK